MKKKAYATYSFFVFCLIPNAIHALDNTMLPMKFSLVPNGTFLMGTPATDKDRADDDWQHEVTITRSFEMQTTEVTQAQWYLVMRDNPSYFKSENDCPGDYRNSNGVSLCLNHPVERVSYDDIQIFLARLNLRSDDFVYRLPTESEWEFAARAGSKDPYSFIGNLSDHMWYENNSRQSSHRVGSLIPNKLGLFDTHGNVWEWTSDWYGDYPREHTVDPQGGRVGSNPNKVVRGGSWKFPARFCRSAYRSFWRPNFRATYVGFRLVREPRVR